MRWNPWRELRRRPHVRLEYREMHPARGRVVDHGNGLQTITIDPRLSRVDRNAALAHELTHLDLGLVWPEGMPEHVVAHGELRVDALTIRRLVPAAELEEFINQRHTIGMVVARDVAEEFDVPVELADRALRRFLLERRSA